MTEPAPRRRPRLPHGALSLVHLILIALVSGAVALVAASGPPPAGGPSAPRDGHGVASKPRHQLPSAAREGSRRDASAPSNGRDPNPALLTERWTASWITAPDATPFGFGVHHFRRTFELTARPDTFLVHASADNRYQLFVNGERVAWGPARGDLYHWRYDTIDIAPHLKAGRNVLAAIVWNFAEHAPQAQQTSQTGFLLQGDREPEHIVNTGPEWKAVRSAAYEPIPITHDEVKGYYVAGPGERFTAARHLWGWEEPSFDDAAWEAARVVGPAFPRGFRDAGSAWMLVPRGIPLMEERPERLRRVRRADGIPMPSAFPGEREAVRIPARTRATLLLDHGQLTTGYPELVTSGGKGASIRLRYAEALRRPDGSKGHRDEIEGKTLLGYADHVVADGGRGRLYRPLWWRTWRYLELQVETADEPLVIDDLRSVYVGYPFERRARFDAGDPEIARILDVGWHTARLCAHETYMDCPYYEQLQYVGDTRIQALVSMYASGDSRLVRNAIELIDSSRTAEGVTMSRAPTRLQQYIPGFSLWWIGMVHDYWRYEDDEAFVRRMLPGVRSVLGYFASLQRSDGSLGWVPFWNYADWTAEWRHGEPPRDPDGSSAVADLQLLLAYGWAADLEGALGTPALASEYRQQERRLRDTIRARYWDPSRQLFADTPSKRAFSQQANVLAVLARVVDGDEARTLVERVLADTTLVQCSIYFRHYLHSAVNQVGLGDRYLSLLDTWRTMLANGLTTWAETADPARSDCHAWGSSPNFEVFRTLLGIDSAAPGFRKVVVRPFPGKLTRLQGSIPHPRGEVRVALTVDGQSLEADVWLPPDVSGEIIWRGVSKPLAGGRNSVAF